MKRISAVIACFNEERFLSSCLDSIKDFSKEIIIFNIGKKSKELEEIALKFNAKIINFSFTPYVEAIRNKMVKEATGEYVLVLDPDERLSEGLKRKLLQVCKEEKFDAVNIPRKNIIFGKWIRHTNWWPDKQIRFFKKGKVFWTSKIHSYPKVMGKILELEEREGYSIIHRQYENFSEFLQRQNRYSDIEAKNLFDEKAKISLINFFLWPAKVFLSRYIKHLGFLDGFNGFSLTYMMMIYKLMVLVKLWEKNKLSD